MPAHPSPSEPGLDLEAVEAAAAAWLSLRDRGMSEAETVEFMRWLQRHPRHAEVFAALDETWRTFNRLAGARPASIEADPDFLAPRLRARSRRSTWAAIGLAAAAAVALVFTGRPLLTPRHTAETEVGAFQKVDLPDGSVVQLNTASAIDVDYTPGERRVRLVRGEAHFSVAKNPDRPFIVSAGQVAVRAVGTAFNVRLRACDVEVLVTEGKVQVNDAAAGRSLLASPDATHPALLVAGERARVAAAAADAMTPAVVAAVTPGEVERALAWQERRLEFESTPLGEVVAEFNRYNRHQLVIADSRLESMRFGGTFRADGYEALVRLLEANFGVTTESSEGKTTLRLAP